MEEVLLSGVKMPDHGPSQMPVWGKMFEAGNGPKENRVKLESMG
jgi:hypothetical protein